MHFLHKVNITFHLLLPVLQSLFVLSSFHALLLQGVNAVVVIAVVCVRAASAFAGADLAELLWERPIAVDGAVFGAAEIV